MSYKRISIRFNLDIEDERNAWELLHSNSCGPINKEVIDSKDLRSPSVSLKDINLRINRQFKKDIETELVLQRYHSPFRVKNPLAEEKCLQRLNKFLEKNPCINRQDYALLVGKTKTQALQDINAFIEKGILKKYGAGRSVVYIKVG